MFRTVLAFLAGFIAFFLTSGIYYGVIMIDAQTELMSAHPETFYAEPKMAFAILGNMLWVGLVQYLFRASSATGVATGAKQGAITLLLVNGGFNLLLLSGFKVVPMNFALLDIGVNAIFGAAAGAAIAAVYGRGSANE